MKLIIIVILFLFCLKAQALDLKIAPNRLSILDLGSLIKNTPTLVNQNLARVYMVSGLADEKNKNALVLQGLKEAGNSDLVVTSEAGISQIHINANSSQGEDLSLNSKSCHTWIKKEIISLGLNRLLIVKLKSALNEYVLAGNPDLISVEKINDFYNPDFLKVFALKTGTMAGVTDIVVPTQEGIYKFTVEIGEKNEHTNSISL